MTPKKDTSHPPKGNGSMQAPGGRSNQPKREASPPAPPAKDEQAARAR